MAQTKTSPSSPPMTDTEAELRRVAFETLGQYFNDHGVRPLPRMEDYILAALRRVQRETRWECMQDVCAICGGRVPTHSRLAEGPNEAGNYVHPGKLEETGRLCDASAIGHRLRATPTEPQEDHDHGK